jgi:phosphohistidine swiveling domain-containing protein
MLPQLVVTPKHWFQDSESHAQEILQLLHVAMAQTLPLPPFLAITLEAFDQFCSLHKLSALEREFNFPLDTISQKKLIDRLKRMALPEILVQELALLFKPHLGKNEVVALGPLTNEAADDFPAFVGEVSALAVIRATWAQLLATKGMSKSRSLLRAHPIFLVANPKHAVVGELQLQDKELVACTLREVANTQTPPKKLYINLLTAEITLGDEDLAQSNTGKLPIQVSDLFKLARGLYRKSLYRHACPIAGNKKELWIQPQGLSTAHPPTHKAVAKTHSPILAKGQSKSKGIAVGSVLLVKHERDWRKVRSHHIVVTDTFPKKVSDISLSMRSLISERSSLGVLVGGHLRELRFPVITGVAHATKLFTNGQVISVDASKATIYAGNRFATGRVTAVYPDQNHGIKTTLKAKVLPAKRSISRIPLYANPRLMGQESEDHSAHKRVVLSWGSSIIKEIGVHPKRLVKDKQVLKITAFIASSIHSFKRAYPDTKLMYALANLEPSFLRRLKFSPEPSKIPASPFSLRGVAKLLVDKDDFVHLELQALAKAHAKRVHMEVILPFVRTPQELIALKRLLASLQLMRGGYLKLFMRVETPSQLTQLESFIDAGIDGVVLDMHRLSQLFSGINASSSDHAPLKSHLYAELVHFINHQLVGISAALPIYAWYTDYDVAYNSELYPKSAKAFIV